MTNSREGVLGNHLTAPTYFRQRGAVPSENDAEMELHRLHAQLYDSLSCSMWGMDRVYVGLHVGRLQGLRPLLPGHGRHRELSCEFTSVNPASREHSIDLGFEPLPCLTSLQFWSFKSIRSEQ